MCCPVCFVCGTAGLCSDCDSLKLMWERAWCVGVVLDSCVLWLEVAS